MKQLCCVVAILWTPRRTLYSSSLFVLSFLFPTQTIIRNVLSQNKTKKLVQKSMLILFMLSLIDRDQMFICESEKQFLLILISSCMVVWYMIAAAKTEFVVVWYMIAAKTEFVVFWVLPRFPGIMSWKSVFSHRLRKQGFFF